MHEGHGGSYVYYRIHALAAQRLGFKTRFFYIGETDGIKESRYGPLQKVRNPKVPADWIRTREFRTGFFSSLVYGTIKGNLSAPLHAGPLTAAIRAHILQNESEGPFIIHTTFMWGGVACKVRDSLAGHRVRVRVVNSVFTTLRHEFNGKLNGVGKSGTYRDILIEWIVFLLIRFFLIPWERRSYRDSDVLLYNYHSVQRMVEGEFGTMPNARMITYSTEAMLERGLEVVEVDRSKRKDTDPPCIVCVSRHDPRKGIDQLIRALGILTSRDVAFLARIGSDGQLF